MPNVAPAKAPTQVAYPRRTAVRTFVQGLLSLATLIPTVVLDARIPTPGLVGQALAGLVLFNQIMAHPAVEMFLQQYLPWLSAAPPAGSLRRAYGLRPAKQVKALPYAAIQRAVTLTHPPALDTIKGWGGWAMLGNDTYGDCVAVTWATVRRIVTRLHTTETYPGLDQVLSVYRTQNPGFDPHGSPSVNGPGSAHDGGMDIQTLLEHLVTIGGPDGVKAVAFAQVDHRDLEQLKNAIATVGFLWLGVTVTDANERAFPKPWTWRPGDTDLGGHSITGTGYTDAGTWPIETWADEGSLTDLYVQKKVNQAWVVIWPEHVAQMTQPQRDQLDAAFYELTGKHADFSQVPPPTPQPAPTPTPAGDADSLLAGQAHSWLKTRHDGASNAALRLGLQSWLKSHGL